jgi:hypothetical protein
MPKILDIAEFRNMVEKTKKLDGDPSSLSHKMDTMDDEVKCNGDYILSRHSSELTMNLIYFLPINARVSNPCSCAALWPNISK